MIYTTKSELLRHQIIDAIRNGTFPVGTRLPSERALENHFGVSRVSVRKALGELREMGVLSGASGCRPVIVSASVSPVVEQIDMAFVSNLNRNVLFDVYRACYEELLQKCNACGIRLSYVDTSRPLPDYLQQMHFRAIFAAGDFDANTMKQLSGRLAPLQEESTRVILLDYWEECPGYSIVGAANEQGGELAAEALLARGCRRLLLAGRRSGYHYVPFVDRRSGFINALHRHGCSCHVVDLMVADNRLILDPLEAYLQEHPETDGIFAITDSVGLEVLHVLNRLHRSVPEQVQVIGFDGLSSGELGRPRLTSVAQPVREIAAAALELATRSEAGTLQSIIPCTMIERDSTRRPE